MDIVQKSLYGERIINSILMREDTLMVANESTDREHQLVDRYELLSGRVLLSGTQALVRIMLDQARLDGHRGLNTAGLISGYRGSPLGGFDQELWRQSALLDRHRIRFEPGLNEDLGATMLWGAQQLEAFPGKKVDGVFSMWYGKGPGVDRSGDVLRSANIVGTSKHGGVLAVAGDDHAAQSSMYPHATEQVFEGAMMPILNPATVEEYLHLGLAGLALSRFSGCWVAFKAVTETVESAASFDLALAAQAVVQPADYQLPLHGLNYDPDLPWPAQRAELERRLVQERLPAVWAFARANGLDRCVIAPERPRVGIVTAGKAHTDVMAALSLLGLDESACRAQGIAVYKVAMTWPLESEGLKAFAAGLDAMLVVEEKRSFVETQIKEALFNLPARQRPVVEGKTRASGEPFIPAIFELAPRPVATLLSDWLTHHRVKYTPLPAHVDTAIAAREEQTLVRKPFFCSGCPHNTSTTVPEGSMAGAGIGCHIMAMGDERKTYTFTQMGGEGVQWVGMAPFTEMPHLFANLGDGTYQHSGVLAIRQAVAAKATITFKILYNDAVAMTGGQPAEGSLSPQAIVAQVKAEGVQRVDLVSEEPLKYLGSALGPGVGVHRREDFQALQEAVRDEPGVSVIVFDQTCAAEKRRRRKRGSLQDSPVRAVINHRVCEGCGDCSTQSNCISIEPRETQWGRKRQINQSSCNKDLSCLKGFCPSFVTVEGVGLRKPETAASPAIEAGFAARLQLPATGLNDGEARRILVTGIGGSGVVTIGAVLATAAHLEGYAVRTLDFTGLAQKNGAVASHVQIATSMNLIPTPRIGEGAVDVLVASDMVTAVSAGVSPLVDGQRTAVIGNLDLVTTSDFVTQRDLPLNVKLHRRTLEKQTNADRSTYVRATCLANALLGDRIATNFFMVGMAFQQGLIPLALQSIERAIELNGVAVELNKRALFWGRVAAVDPDAVENLAGLGEQTQEDEPPEVLIQRLSEELAAWQDKAYADRYRHSLDTVVAAERKVTGKASGLSAAVARNLFKLMAYKDEYEVARLHLATFFSSELDETFEAGRKLTFHLAPPLITRINPATGRPRKLALPGKLVQPLFAVLARARHIRGSWLDPFRFQKERQRERELIGLYQADVALIVERLSRFSMEACSALAAWPDEVRGFGPVKEAAIDTALARRDELSEQLKSGERQAPGVRRWPPGFSGRSRSGDAFRSRAATVDVERVR